MIKIIIILITEAKFGGKELLNLNKESLEQFGLSTEFQTPLMKFIEDLVCHRYKLMRLCSYTLLYHDCRNNTRIPLNLRYNQSR